MNDFARDPLARRLSELDLSEPDPLVVTRRVLARHASERARLPMRWGVAVVLPLLFLPLSLGTAYYAPAFAQAVADAPIAGAVTGPLLRQLGLAGISHRVSVLGDRAIASGYEVELVAGYADASRTVLFLRATPPALIVALATDALGDQFSRSYRLTSAIADAQTGEAALTFVPLQWPASWVGARLTLDLGELEDRIGPAPRTITGRWHVTGTLGVNDGRELSLPVPVELGDMRFTFTMVRSLPAALLVEFNAEHATAADLSRRIPDGGKGRPAFTAQLFAPGGIERPLLGAEMSGSGETVNGRWLWQTDEAADHELVLSYVDVGRVSRPIAAR